MRAVVWPFLEYLLLQCFVVTAGLTVVRDERLGFDGALKSWIFGQMLLYAVLQLMAVPMILLHCRFSTLFWCYVTVSLVLSCVGLLRLLRKKTLPALKRPEFNPFAVLLFVIAALLILWQGGMYFFGVHLDEDDSRWIAQANDALEYGYMMNWNFNTGELDTVFTVPRDVTSPWPMMYAVVSRLLHTRPAVFAHSIYPPVELLVMYGVYWLVSGELFQKLEARLTFLMMAALIHLFFAGDGNTQADFALSRIWQGKSTVAAVVLPLLFYLVLRANRDPGHRDKENGVALFLASMAACLMSGMGISLGPVMLGLFGAYNVLAYRNWRSIPKWGMALLPGVVYTLVYHFALGTTFEPFQPFPS